MNRFELRRSVDEYLGALVRRDPARITLAPSSG